MGNTQNSDGTVTENHIRIIHAVRTGYRGAHLLPIEEQSWCLRSLHRAWVAGNVQEIIVLLDTVAVLLENVEGAYDRYAAVRAASASVAAVCS